MISIKNESKVLEFEDFNIVEFDNSINVVGGGGTNGTSSDVVGTEN